jgi:hypothetical protein
VHRRGSNGANGDYFGDYDPRRPIGHSSTTRQIDTAALRRRYEELSKLDGAALAARSPLAPGTGAIELPRYFAQRYAPPESQGLNAQVSKSLKLLNKEGYWPAPLPQNSHTYKGVGRKAPATGDFATTHVGDETDTSPFNDTTGTLSITTAEYLRNMNVLIQWLTQAPGT